ncbi:MAG: hypothetical protein LBP19_10615 [Treponema sp.]|jgi:hypothetical protein|nr:hypothetical protein [Treponema sp.]
MTDNLESLSNSILSLDFAAKGCILFILICFLVVFAVFFLYTYYKNSLLAQSAGKKKRLPVVFVSVGETFGNIINTFLVPLPILGGIIVAVSLTLGIFKTVSAVNEFIDREKEIKALTIAINYLNQSDKALDVRVRSVVDGAATIRLDYKASDPDDSSTPPVEWTKTITIHGTEIHVDCMVFNFSYSEVGAGRQRNIAIPYRVFSNKIAAVDGVFLFSGDAVIPEEDDYGFIPRIYRERLTKLLTDPNYARDMGIRSVNGSDVWRANVQTGDRFRITVEQTGGLTLKIL